MWVAKKESELRAARYWTNGLAYNQRLQHARITSYQSASGDWAINQYLLKHGLELLLKGWTVDVMLLTKDEQPISCWRVSRFAVLLDTYPNDSKDPDHGPYYWVNKEGLQVPLR